MKMKQMLLFLLMMVFSLSTSTVFASASVTQIPSPTAKKGIIEKFKVKVATIAVNKLMKANPDSSILDKDKKFWLRLWLIGMLVGLVVGITGLFVPFVAYISYIIGVITLAAFVIWLLKVFDAL